MGKIMYTSILHRRNSCPSTRSKDFSSSWFLWRAQTDEHVDRPTSPFLKNRKKWSKCSQETILEPLRSERRENCCKPMQRGSIHDFFFDFGMCFQFSKKEAVGRWRCPPIWRHNWRYHSTFAAVPRRPTWPSYCSISLGIMLLDTPSASDKPPCRS